MTETSLPNPVHDPARLEALARTGLLDSPSEEAFDRFTRLAAHLLRTPIALISLVAEDRQFFKSAVGLPEPWASRRETPLSHSFCQHLVASGTSLVVRDAHTDPVLATNLAVADLGVVAYLGIPLRTAEGAVLGSFCTIDTVPRKWTDEEIRVLDDLAQGVMAEIESRRLATEAAARAAEADESRHRLHALFMQAPAIIAITRGPEHVFEFVNPPFLQIVGTRECIGRPVREALPEIIEQGFPALLDQVYASGEPYIGSEQRALIDRRGDRTLEEGFFNFVYQPTRDADGQVDGIMIHAVEVTNQVRARQQAEQLAAERAAVLAHIADGVIITDAAGRITFVNEAAHELHGVSALGVGIDEYTETYHLLTMAGEPYPPHELPLARAVECGETVIDAEWRIRRPDGTEIIAEGSAAPVRDVAGTQVGAVLTLRDVTLERTLERQRRELLATISHDLKNPLAVISGQAQFLARLIQRGSTDRDSRLLSGLESVRETAARMTGQIQELLDLARMQSGEPLMLNRRPLDLVPFLERLVLEHQQTTDRHRLRLLTEEQELTGEWDAERLERVVANLLANAIKYSPGGGDITVYLSRLPAVNGRRTRASIVFEDGGIGIPPADLPHVFNRFYRASNVDAHMPGTGLGLAGVRQIVEAHGGAVAIESEPQCGTRVKVHLPLEDALSAKG